MFKNNIVRYFILIIIVIDLGITSRKINGVPTLIGDMLYAVMIYFGMRMLFINITIKKTVILAMFLCFGIEFLQLYTGEWMVEIRRTTAGHYVLGQGFLWTDLIYYALGIGTALYVDFKFIARK